MELWYNARVFATVFALAVIPLMLRKMVGEIARKLLGIKV